MEHVCWSCDVSWPEADGRTCWSCGVKVAGQPLTLSDANLWRQQKPLVSYFHPAT